MCYMYTITSAKWYLINKSVMFQQRILINPSCRKNRSHQDTSIIPWLVSKSVEEGSLQHPHDPIPMGHLIETRTHNH